MNESGIKIIIVSKNRVDAKLSAISKFKLKTYKINPLNYQETIAYLDSLKDLNKLNINEGEQISSRLVEYNRIFEEAKGSIRALENNFFQIFKRFGDKNKILSD